MRGRLALLLGAASAVGLGVKGARAWARRSKSRLRELPPDELWGALGVEPDGRPTVVAFSTPGCAVCRTTQAPALLDLESRLAGAVRVLRVDAAAQPATAEVFDVATVPTTVVLASDGRVSEVNHGFAPAETLAAQVAAAR
jgi:thioredoxin-like negative regulator of GroEL